MVPLFFQKNDFDFYPVPYWLGGFEGLIVNKFQYCDDQIKWPFLAIWDSISYELIIFEKKPNLVLSVPYWLGGFPTDIVEKVLVAAQFRDASFSSHSKQFQISQ